MRKAGLLFVVAMFFLTGCAATQVALEKKDLNVQTIMSDTLFLDIESQTARSVFVDVRNTSDKEFDLAERIKSKLQAKGYTLVQNPKDAGYLLQVNVLQVGMCDPAALRTSVYGGFGSTIGAGLAGATAGALVAGNSAAGGAVGGVLFGVGDMVAGSLVKDVTYSVMTDVMISEKTKSKVSEKQTAKLAKGKGTKVQQTVEKESNRQRYQTRIASSANQVNLKFEDALRPLQEGLAKSIAGIF